MCMYPCMYACMCAVSAVVNLFLTHFVSQRLFCVYVCMLCMRACVYARMCVVCMYSCILVIHLFLLLLVWLKPAWFANSWACVRCTYVCVCIRAYINMFVYVWIQRMSKHCVGWICAMQRIVVESERTRNETKMCDDRQVRTHYFFRGV